MNVLKELNGFALSILNGEYVVDGVVFADQKFAESYMNYRAMGFCHSSSMNMSVPSFRRVE